MFTDFFNFRWQDLIDIALTAILIYQLLLFLRGTQGIQIMAGILILLLAYWGARRLDLFTLEWLLESFVKSLILIIIILFQADIRRMLSRVGRRAVFRFGYSAPRVMEEIAAAADSLAKNKFGGLFVLKRQGNLQDVLEGGISLDAVVSRELLVTLFWPHSPTHDGAAIISGDQILAAGCVLPLTQRPGLDKALGTRHRAGLGITEHSDAVAIIVSEEKGHISLAQEGKLTPNLSRTQLLLSLNEIFSSERSERVNWLEKIPRFFEKK
ncbi:MAG: TIGR00159 family protein [Deltaproteobacteria bacterium]|nr:TIGR00159 family protein [Deltaproteobacteria bacterium]